MGVSCLVLSALAEPESEADAQRPHMRQMYQPYGFNFGNYYNRYQYPGTYNFGYRHFGKREAEAEPEADPQVFYQLQNQMYQPYGFNYGYNFRNNYYNTYRFPNNYRTYGFNYGN